MCAARRGDPWEERNLDAARHARLAANETCAFEVEDHLVDGGRGYTEVALHLALSGRASMHARVGVDEGQVLALLGREAGSAFARHLIHLSIRLGLQSGGSDECTLSHHVDPIRAKRASTPTQRI